MLEVTDLTKTYGSGNAAHLAIDRVSLNVARGGLVSIVGPSGCDGWFAAGTPRRFPYPEPSARGTDGAAATQAIVEN